MIRFTRQRALVVTALGTATLLAGCGDKTPPPPPPPPPPPVVVVIPPKPTPPNDAAANLAIPAVDATGLRYSVNRNITPAQTLWNLRSAYNVAALNCHEPRHADILVNYKAFLKNHQAVLAKANKTVDAEFRKKYGASFIVPREKYMTEVYNHFALPPTMSDFCTAVLAVGRDAQAIKSSDLEAFAARSLPNIEIVFDEFYRKYDDYRVRLAEWQAKYAPATAVTIAPLQATSANTAAVGTGVPTS